MFFKSISEHFKKSVPEHFKRIPEHFKSVRKCSQTSLRTFDKCPIVFWNIFWKNFNIVPKTFRFLLFSEYFKSVSKQTRFLKKVFRSIKMFSESVLELLVYPKTVCFPKCSRTFFKLLKLFMTKFVSGTFQNVPLEYFKCVSEYFQKCIGTFIQCSGTL